MRWLSRLLIVLLVVVTGLSVQDSLEFYVLKAWIGLTQPARPTANPLGRAVADVVLREYYDRLEAVAFYRSLEACKDKDCLDSVLYDLDPHANLYTSEGTPGTESCNLRPQDGQVTPKGAAKTIYLRIRAFELDEGCFEQIWKVMQQAKAPNSLIVDLRGNGGGYFEDALALASFFIPAGTRLIAPLERYPQQYLDDYLRMPLLITQNGVASRKGERYPFTDNQTRKVEPGQILILLDQGTASASEIFANLLNQQDNARVLLVGDEFSTGVGNTIMDTFSVGDYELELPTAVLPGLGVFAEPEISLEEAAKKLGFQAFPAIEDQ